MKYLISIRAYFFTAAAAGAGNTAFTGIAKPAKTKWSAVPYQEMASPGHEPRVAVKKNCFPGRLFAYIIITLACLAGPAAVAQPLQATATINRDSILIGEPVTLRLQVTGSDTALNNFAWFEPNDTFGHFEVVEKGELKRLVNNGLTTTVQEFTLTSFDSGRWEIPPFISGSAATPPLKVIVGTVPVLPNDEVRDIKEIIQVKKPFNYLFMGIVIAGLLALLIIWWRIKRWLKRRAKQVFIPVNKGLSPYEEATAALKQLEAQAWLQNGKVKAWHTELDRIVKQYLSRQSGLSILEQTSRELKQVLRGYRLPPEVFERMEATLNINDAVKFAKFQPTPQESVQCMLTTRSTITHIHQHNA